MKKILLAGRGGGAKSVTMVGTVKALQEENLPVYNASGSSLASIIATMTVLKIPADEMLEFFKENAEKFSNASPLKGGKGQTIIGDEAKKFCGNLKFRDLEGELYIAANQGSIISPKRFIFSKATTPDACLCDAIMASCSFPVLFLPYKYKYNGKKYHMTDGGMVANPYIPLKTPDTLYIVSSFRKKKENYNSIYKNAWLLPKLFQADILLDPYIGKMGTLGNSDDVELAFKIGYYETLKKISLIREKLE